MYRPACAILSRLGVATFSITSAGMPSAITNTALRVDWAIAVADARARQKKQKNDLFIPCCLSVIKFQKQIPKKQIPNSKSKSRNHEIAPSCLREIKNSKKQIPNSKNRNHAITK
jgi:hypothetical protein